MPQLSNVDTLLNKIISQLDSMLEQRKADNGEITHLLQEIEKNVRK